MPDLSVSFYDEIEAVLVRSGRGSDFLAEHARRSRTADTQALLDSIARLEARVGERVPGDLERLRSDLADLTDVIRSARTATAPGPSGPESLGDVLTELRRSAAAGSGAAEQVQETAWNMRERGFDTGLCDDLDGYASGIQAACAGTETGVARLGPILRAVALVEERVAAMRRVWGTGRPAHAPPLDESPPVISNEDIDFVQVDAPLPPSSDLEDVPDERSAVTDLKRIRSLDTRDTLRVFT